MEKNLIVMPTKSKPPPPPPTVPSYVATHYVKKSNNVSFARRNDAILTDAHLNQLCKNGSLSEAGRIMDSLAQKGSQVRANTYINLLQSCIDKDSIQIGRELHARIHLVKNVDPFVETKLVSMYAKCGYLDEARKVFDGMRERNLFTWSAMIGAFSRAKKWEEVVELFYYMINDGFLPDEFLLPKIIKACGKCGDIETSKLIHSLAIRCGMCSSDRVNNSILAAYAKCGEMSDAKRFFCSMDERDGVAWNSLITGYCQMGEIERARELFDRMHEEKIEPGLVTWNVMIATYNQLGHCDIAIDLMRKMESSGITPDVYTWTSMISGLTQNGRINKSFDFLNKMFLAGIEPTGITILSVVSACAYLKSLNMGLEIHSVAVKRGWADDVAVGNSLIDMYAKCGNLEAAQRVFDTMLKRDVYTWNSIIGGYCQAGYCGKAHELFMEMQESDVAPNVITWNAMITGFIQNGDEDQALDLFQKIERDGKIKRNAASWNSLISGYTQSGDKDKALRIFRHMQSLHITPNSVTMLSILPALGNLVAGRKVKEIHCCALRRNLVFERSVSNLLIDTYAKSGNIAYSRNIFDGMSSKDIISWNSMIAGYVLHGHSESALCLFNQMKNQGLQPSRGTFASIILAYGLAGLLDEGKCVFSSISEDYYIKPGFEHYSAVVYLLGRSGRLAEALEFIKDMPIEPNSSVWGALLTACMIHRNFGLAILAGERLLDLEPRNILIHQLLSKAYSLCGKSWEALKVTRLEKEKVVRKPVGQSWIESKNMVHTFVTGDQSKPYSDKPYSWIERVAVNMKGPVSDYELCIEEEEKEKVSSVHSEKLALAFAFLDSHCAPKTIRIVKNLRMCRDCHRTAKHISAAYGCEIYISDSTCFHHFKGGCCSCGDYW